MAAWSRRRALNSPDRRDHVIQGVPTRQSNGSVVSVSRRALSAHVREDTRLCSTTSWFQLSLLVGSPSQAHFGGRRATEPTFFWFRWLRNPEMTFRATAMEQQLRANAEPQPDKLTIRALECRKTICFIETAAASPGDLPITDYRWRACRIASDEMLPGRAPLPQVKCYRRRRLPPCSLQHLGGVMAPR